MMESKKDRDISGALVGAAAEIRKRSTMLSDVIKTRDRDHQLIKDFANQIEQLLRPPLQECESGRLSSEQMAQSLISACRSALNYSRAITESKLGESHHAKGYIEGLGAAADLIGSMGAAALREAERVETLAASEEDLEKRRRVGSRPESLRVKRKAAELRQKNDDHESSDVETVDPAE